MNTGQSPPQGCGYSEVIISERVTAGSRITALLHYKGLLKDWLKGNQSERLALDQQQVRQVEIGAADGRIPRRAAGERKEIAIHRFGIRQVDQARHGSCRQVLLV